MEPTSYCGASRGHVHFENFVLSEDYPLKLFQRNEIDEETFWLDMKKCSGIINCKTFCLVPKLEILNLMDCKMQKIGDNSFGILESFKSLDVRGSVFPFETNTFTNCKLTSIALSDLEIKPADLSELKYLEDISFTNCIFSTIGKGAFSSFASLNTLSFSSCQIDKIDSDAFDELEHLVELQFMECNIESLDFNCFLKLTSLKYLSFHVNNCKTEINYEIFKNLPSLENIFFNLEIYKELNFSQYSKLNKVRIGYGNDEKIDEELRNSVISLLSEKNISYELVFTGKVEVNMDEVQICA